MEKVLVKDFKKSCSQFADEIYAYYDKAQERGADESDLRDLANIMTDLNVVAKNANSDTINTSVILLNRIKADFANKKAFIDAYLRSRDDIKREEELKAKEEEPIVVEKVHKSRFGLGLLTGILVSGIVVGGVGICHYNKYITNKDEVVEENDEMNKGLTPGSGDNKEDTPAGNTQDNTQDNTQTDENKVVVTDGSFGQFVDVKDNEQVEARAKYIINNYFGTFMDKLSEQEKAIITEENIANVIRVLNGELPLDQEGNPIMNGNVVDYYGQLFTNLVGDLGSSPQLEGRYVNVPAYMFVADNTKLQEFVKSYDDAYQKITDGFNLAADQRLEGQEVTGGTLVREGIAELGEKFWNEWVMQGIYGDVNPYNFLPEERLEAFFGAFVKYGAYAFEYNLNAKQAVCIPVCIDYNTKEKMEIPVNEIFVGYVTGEWDTVIAKAAGIEVTPEPDSIAFTQDLMDHLNWVYDHRNVKTFN